MSIKGKAPRQVCLFSRAGEPNRNLIPAFFLRPVQRPVGDDHQIVDIIGVNGGGGDPLADSGFGDGLAFIIRKGQLGEGVSNPVSDHICLGSGGIGQKDCKFFPAPAADDIGFFDVGLNRLDS